MIKSSYLFYLLSLFKTKSFAEEVLEKIDELKENLYNRRIDLDKKMGELFSYEMKEKIKSFAWQEQINLNDPESFGKFLSDIRTFIKNMPVVTISIAFQPDDEIVKQISEWFTEQYGKNVVLDLIFDKSLIGGAVIVFNETSKDFSIKKRLDEKYKPQDWLKFVEQVRAKPSARNNYTPLKTKKSNGEFATA